MPPSRTPLRPGVYAPTVTFFDRNTEELDTASIRRHAVRLAKAGLVGLVTMGSNGEAVHLSREERKAVTRETRSALDEAGFHSVPVILYNYPGAVAGIDMDSDLIIRISQHPNVVGTKFTCANTGKLTRVARSLNAITPPSLVPFFPKADILTKEDGHHPYVVFGGMADFSLQTLVSGGSAILAGGANVVPRLCVSIFDLWAQGRITDAIEQQQLLSEADWILTKSSIPGTKSTIETYYGYGGYARRPLGRLSSHDAKMVADGIKNAIDKERTLPDVV